MTAIDNATDRATAAFDNFLEAIENSFDHDHLLLLDATQSARKNAASTLRQALFPEGTSYLRLPYLQQWSRLDSLGKALAANEQTLQVLGLTLEATRLRAWIDLYGARLGITQAPTVQADQVAQAIQAWHEAWGGFLSAVMTEHDSAQDGDLQFRALLRFYTDQGRRGARPRAALPQEAREPLIQRLFRVADRSPACNWAVRDCPSACNRAVRDRLRLATEQSATAPGKPTGRRRRPPACPSASSVIEVGRNGPEARGPRERPRPGSALDATRRGVHALRTP
jgi:hypothetical protein